jgi:hypothetical protein
MAIFIFIPIFIFIVHHYQYFSYMSILFHFLNRKSNIKFLSPESTLLLSGDAAKRLSHRGSTDIKRVWRSLGLDFRQSDRFIRQLKCPWGGECYFIFCSPRNIKTNQPNELVSSLKEMSWHILVPFMRKNDQFHIPQKHFETQIHSQGLLLLLLLLGFNKL